MNIGIDVVKMLSARHLDIAEGVFIHKRAEKLFRQAKVQSNFERERAMIPPFFYCDHENPLAAAARLTLASVNLLISNHRHCAAVWGGVENARWARLPFFASALSTGCQEAG